MTQKIPTKAIIMIMLPVVALTATFSTGTALLFYSYNMDKTGFRHQYGYGFLAGAAMLNILAVLFILILNSYYKNSYSKLWKVVLFTVNIPLAILYLIYFSTTFPLKP